jgi:hypothetical protein
MANRPPFMAQKANRSQPSRHWRSGKSARRQTSIRPMPSMP